MQKKNKHLALFFAVLMITSAMLIALPIEVKAQDTTLQPNLGMPLPEGVTPVYTRKTFAYLSVSPNPIGVGQEALVNVFTTPGTDRFKGHRDYTVTITKPDGTQEVKVMNSYWADATSWLTISPDQTGEWKLKFEFPGNYFPAGTYADPQGGGGAALATRTWDEYYTPSSTPETILKVQDQPVPHRPESPLPTDYWTRPISLENREWWTIAGWYPWRGPGGGPEWDEHYPNTNPYWSARQQFTPWTLGPNSPHIVWKERFDVAAGLIGGDLRNWYIDAPVDIREFAFDHIGTHPYILYNGLAYRSKTTIVDGEPDVVWECFDIRTGEYIWQRKYIGAQVPTIIDFDIASLAVPGVSPKPARPELVYLGNSRLIKYNPQTGAATLNVSISPMTGSGGTYYMNGHVLGIQDLGSAAGTGRYRLINWTTLGSSSSFAPRIISNITWPWSSLGTDQDFNTGLSALVTGGGRDATQIRAASLLTGSELWNTTTDESMYMVGCTKVDHGKVAVLMRGGYYKAWDLLTGKVVWTSEKMLYPWGETGWASYSVASAYGMLYQQLNDGIYAFDWETGKIVWRYEDPAPYPFEYAFTGKDGASVVPFYNFRTSIRIADGKVYVTNGRHSPEMPFQRGYGFHAIDAFTGDRVWRVNMRQGGFGGAGVGQVHDGYISILGADGYFYVIGKGRSETTVNAPSTGVHAGQIFTITGTVVDLSPAQKGTAAISDEDMGGWMEYLHLQMPKLSDAKGVTVELTAIDPNGNLIDIGQTTSNTDGVYGFTWAPEVPGLYQIIATFAGSDSYGSSSASTYLSATDGPSATPEPTPLPLSVADVYFVPAIAALFIAIIIVGAFMMLMLRKRP
jgi:hypothetical protein